MLFDDPFPISKWAGPSGSSKPQHQRTNHHLSKLSWRKYSKTLRYLQVSKTLPFFVFFLEEPGVSGIRRKIRSKREKKPFQFLLGGRRNLKLNIKVKCCRFRSEQILQYPGMELLNGLIWWGKLWLLPRGRKKQLDTAGLKLAWEKDTTISWPYASKSRPPNKEYFCSEV